MFSKQATKNDKIFTVNLTLTSYCQITTHGEDFVNFCGLHKLYVFQRQLQKSFDQFSNSVSFLKWSENQLADFFVIFFSVRQRHNSRNFQTNIVQKLWGIFSFKYSCFVTHYSLLSFGRLQLYCHSLKGQ